MGQPTPTRPDKEGSVPLWNLKKVSKMARQPPGCHDVIVYKMNILTH